MPNPFEQISESINPFNPSPSSEASNPFKDMNTPLKGTLSENVGPKYEKGSLSYDLAYTAPKNFIQSVSTAAKELPSAMIKIGGDSLTLVGKKYMNTAEAYAQSIVDPSHTVEHLANAFAKNNEITKQQYNLYSSMVRGMYEGQKDSFLLDVGFVNDSDNTGKWKWKPFGYIDKEGQPHPSMIRRNVVDRPFETLNDALFVYSLAKYGVLKGAKYVPPGSKAPETALSRITKMADDIKIKNPKLAAAQDFLHDWHNYEQTGLIKSAAQDLFYRTQNKSAKLISDKIGKLSELEAQKFGLYVSGIEPLPSEITPGLRKAIRTWNLLDNKNKKFLIKGAEVLNEDTVDMRRWKPAVAKKVGQPINVSDIPENVEGVKDLTVKEFNEIKKVLQKEVDYTDSIKDAKPGDFLTPRYYPFIEEGAEGVRPGSLTPKKENFLKTAKMYSLFQETYEKDPAKVLLVHQSQVNRMVGNRQIADNIVKMPTTIPYHGTAAENKLIEAGTHIKWNPKGWLTEQQIASILDSKLMHNLEQYGDTTYAMNKAVYEMMPTIKELYGNAAIKEYLVPKKVFDTLHYYVPQNPNPMFNLIQSGGKSAYNVWRWMVLQGRPKWLVNNAVGNGIMGTLAGGISDTSKYGKNIERMIPSNLEDTYFLTLQSMQPPSKYNYLGKYTNYMSKLNYEVDNLVRRGVYIKQAEQFAKKNLLLNSGKKTFTANEITKELIRIAKEEPGQVNELINYVNDFLPDFQHMSTLEREVIRKAVPFWGFIRHQIMLDAKLLYKYPDRSFYVRNLEKAAEAITDPKDLEDLKEGKVFGIDTRGPNPLLIGTPLNVISPLIKAPIEWASQRSLSAGMDYSAPYALQLKGGGYLVADEQGNPKVVKYLKSPLYTAAQQIPYTAAGIKYLQDHADMTGKKVLKAWKIKDLPETLLNLFVVGTYHKNEQMEKLQDAQLLQLDLNNLVKQMGEAEFRKRIENNPEKLKPFIDELLRQHHLKKKVLIMDDSNPFDQKTSQHMDNINKTILSEIALGGGAPRGNGSPISPSQLAYTEPFENPFNERRA